MAKKIKTRSLDQKPLDQEGVEEVVDQVEAVAEDAGASGGDGLEDFISRHRNLIFGGLGVLVLVVGGFLAYSFMKQNQNAEANLDMFPAVYDFESDSMRRAVEGDGQNLGLLEIADEYSGTRAADMANYYIGIYYLSADSPQVDLGIEYLEKVSNSNSMLNMATYSALAFAYEDLGEFEKAADLFEDAAYTPAENKNTTPTMLFHAGRNYEAAGNKSAAREVYQTIKEKYPTSSEGLTIDKYLGRVAG